MASLITRNDFRYGLTAKAYGPNIVYSGSSSIGTVNNAVTGSSIATTASSSAASAAESACENAPASTNSYTLSPQRLNLSTGDTQTQITISASQQGISLNNVSYSTNLLNNNASGCQVTLSFGSPQSASTTVMASPSGCSGTFSVTANVNTTTTNSIKVIVPPQKLIQVLVGEAGGRSQVLMEALGNAIGSRYMDPAFASVGNTSWQDIINSGQFDGYNDQTKTVANGISPELAAAANVFSQAQPINIVPGATCFFSPDDTGWSRIQQAQSQNATTVPVPIVNHDPKCYENPASGAQFVIKTSLVTYSTGKPYFIFVRPKQANDQAIVQVP